MLLKVKDLELSKLNPRKTAASKAAHDQLVASIREHGLIIPLVVRANGSGRWEVIDGGRRFAAVQELGLDEVECTVNKTDFASDELGTAANMIRAAMHPLDECAVISRLVADGELMEDVGRRFGQTIRWVEQRLDLNGLGDKAKQAFRDGKFGLAAAQALTLGSDKEQAGYLREAEKNSNMLNADWIKRAMTAGKINVKHALFDPAELPKGSLVSDLFGDEIYCDDRDEFFRLQIREVEERGKLLASAGWGNIIIQKNGQSGADDTKYVQVAKVKQSDRKRLSVRLTILPSGEVKITENLALRKEVKDGKIVKQAKPADDRAEAVDVEAKTPEDMSATQLQILGALATEAIEQEIKGGNIWLAYYTLLQPLLAGAYRQPWMAGVPRKSDYGSVNAMLEDKIEAVDNAEQWRFPSAESFKAVDWDAIHELVCHAACRSIAQLNLPHEAAVKVLKQHDHAWFHADKGFLKRYRTDQLEELAERLKLKDFVGLTKSALIDAISERCTEDNIDLAKYIKLPTFGKPSSGESDER